MEQKSGDGSSHSAVIQEGSGNTAEVTQSAVVTLNNSSIALIGAENSAIVSQHGRYANTNESEIFANGAGNEIQVLQGDKAAEVSYNASTISIDGVGNIVHVAQDNPSGAGVFSATNSSLITIIGNGNTATVVQSD